MLFIIYYLVSLVSMFMHEDPVTWVELSLLIKHWISSFGRTSEID